MTSDEKRLKIKKIRKLSIKEKIYQVLKGSTLALAIGTILGSAYITIQRLYGKKGVSDNILLDFIIGALSFTLSCFSAMLFHELVDCVDEIKKEIKDTEEEIKVLEKVS
jgi:hypothetical protein